MLELSIGCHFEDDCGAAEIQRLAENAPRWPDVNT
jgi:hypothetical protein